MVGTWVTLAGLALAAGVLLFKYFSPSPDTQMSREADLFVVRGLSTMDRVLLGLAAALILLGTGIYTLERRNPLFAIVSVGGGVVMVVIRVARHRRK